LADLKSCDFITGTADKKPVLSLTEAGNELKKRHCEVNKIWSISNDCDLKNAFSKNACEFVEVKNFNFGL